MMLELTAGATATRSRFEDWGVELLRAHDFHALPTNTQPPGTPRWVEVDILFPQQRLVVEIDGSRWHDTPWRREHDAHKRSMLIDAGYPVLVLTDPDAEPAHEGETVEKIRRALDEAAAT